MNNRITCVLGITIFWTLVSSMTSCSGIQVATQKDPNAELASLRTYEWQRPRPGGPSNSIIDTQIEKSVQFELSRIGVEPAFEGKQPDFIISYNASVLNIVTQ